jgi:hypothetical protein
MVITVLVFAGCSDPAVRIDGEAGGKPVIFPDYTDVTIPGNISPLNFRLEQNGYGASRLLLACAGEEIRIKGKSGSFHIPVKKWRKLLELSTGKDIRAVVCVEKEGRWMSFEPFYWHVAREPVDPYIAYRLIAPGYTLWHEMGIYQRRLDGYRQDAVIENRMTGNNCMNCHAFCNREPDRMLFHMRKTYPGTYITQGKTVEKLNTKTEHTVSALVYPSWHPSGKYVAFTVNDTRQSFHMNDPNRIEVYDMASDVVVYDTDKRELLTVPPLFSKQCYETFPTFSPDGRTLYFCTAGVRNIPDDFEKIRYSLCSIPFDPERRTFGESVDTLYNAEAAGKSAALPRVSPDGKYLLFTLSAYGNFFIWHKDADLYMINLETGALYPLTEANSDFAESYHSWSSNSRWIVFSSRRMDGLYTHPYFSYIDGNGKAAKPFMLPQKDTGFYHRFMKSYNVPEFVKGKINLTGIEIVDRAKKDKGFDITFPDGNKFPVLNPVEEIAH